MVQFMVFGQNGLFTGIRRKGARELQEISEKSGKTEEWKVEEGNSGMVNETATERELGRLAVAKRPLGSGDTR